MNIKRNFGTLALVVAMAAGTAGATLLAGDVSADAKPATQKIVVRPVTATGHAARGFNVVTEPRSVRCTAPSVVAVDKGIAFCGSSADYTVACWRSATPHRVLCLSNPWSKRLESIRLSGAFPKVRAPKHPQPQGLRLTNGSKYQILDGGASGRLRQHPSWVAYYFGGKNSTSTIYGPKGGHAVNMRHATWFVTTFASAKARGVRHDVNRAYYVGTAS